MMDGFEQICSNAARCRITEGDLQDLIRRTDESERLNVERIMR